MCGGHCLLYLVVVDPSLLRGWFIYKNLEVYLAGFRAPSRSSGTLILIIFLVWLYSRTIHLTYSCACLTPYSANHFSLPTAASYSCSCTELSDRVSSSATFGACSNQVPAGPRALLLLRAGYFWFAYLVKVMSRCPGNSRSGEELQGYYESVNPNWAGVQPVRPAIQP